MVPYIVTLDTLSSSKPFWLLRFDSLPNNSWSH
jgi:hypothetical protein